MPYYIHKHEVSLEYGGPEEGGWWYNVGIPADDWDPVPYRQFNEGDAYVMCRRLNKSEHERREKEEDYEFTSVLAHRSTHYEYSVHETPTMEIYPATRPHYE